MKEPIKEEEEKQRLEEKYVRIMKQGLKEFKNDEWKRRKIYCLHGNQQKIDEVIWRLTIAARKMGLEVANILKDKVFIAKIHKAYLGDREASVWISDKVFIAKMSDIPNIWDYLILRGHVGGYWLIICDRDPTDCCVDYHFFF